MYIKKSMQIAFVLGVLAFPLFARDELPPWVETRGGSTGFPRQLFVTGFGMSSDDKKVPIEEKVDYAKSMALASLASGLRVQISSEKIVSSFSSIVDGDEELLDEYRARVVAKSDLNLDGVCFRQYSDSRGRRAYALAYLDRAAAITHYRNKFKGKLGVLVELQEKGNSRLAAKEVALARDTYLLCDQVIGELEEIIMLQELLGDTAALPEDGLRRILDAKNKSRALWEKTADTMREAATQLAMKLGRQETEETKFEGKVQVNALMLDDSYQYSQFSHRFRSILEGGIQSSTKLRPLMADEMDFTPRSSGVARHQVAANGADYLLSGTYFVKDNEIHFYVRLSDAGSGEVLATANAKMKLDAAGGLELKPRNYVQALIDKKEFNKDEIVGGALNLEVWTNKGTEGLAVEEDEDLKIYVRVNQPCYLRFIYHLCNGARVVPEQHLMNYYIDITKVNKVVELPEEFVICAPFGSETMQFFASTEMLPPVGVVARVFDGEEYEVISDELAESNIRYRGIKKKKKDVEVAERRIMLTTVKR